VASPHAGRPPVTVVAEGGIMTRGKTGTWIAAVGGLLASLAAIRHRVVGGVDLLPRPDGASWRGRLGYRYARRHAFAGAGFGIDGVGLHLSPELGVKFMHADKGNDCVFDPALHLLVRAEKKPEKANLRGATVLLGWNLF
jgi:hypothetical protein